MSVQQVAVPSITNPADREKLFKVIRDCSDSLIRAQAEKDFVKEAVADISKQLQLPKRLVKKLVTTYYKQNFDEEVTTHEQFETLYETVVK